MDTMQQIINTNLYRETQQFIYQHIREPFLSDATRNKLVDLYNTLTIDNAGQVYNQAKYLYLLAQNEAMKPWLDFRKQMMYDCWLILAFCGIIFLLAWFAEYIVRIKDSKIIEAAQVVTACILFLALMIGISVAV